MARLTRGILAGLIVLIIGACTVQQRTALEGIAGLVTARSAVPTPSASPGTTPAFSALRTATPAPTSAGPLATLTAIAGFFSTPTQDPRPYEIILRGQPHFIEFFAWW